MIGTRKHTSMYLRYGAKTTCRKREKTNDGSSGVQDVSSPVLLSLLLSMLTEHRIGGMGGQGGGSGY